MAELDGERSTIETRHLGALQLGNVELEDLDVEIRGTSWVLLGDAIDQSLQLTDVALRQQRDGGANVARDLVGSAFGATAVGKATTTFHKATSALHNCRHSLTPFACSRDGREL